MSNAIWDKRGPLTAPELERVRLHPYLTERMLASSAGLAPLGAIAVQHHERLDGSGYPRGLTRQRDDAAGQGAGQRRRLPRDDRAAPAPPGALRGAGRDRVARGRGAALFDADTVDAVLRAAGHAVKRRRNLPAGLTPREVEVLRLLVRGLSYKEIAQELVISRKTAGAHVEHIYTKLGVSNRARASLFAMKHGLMGGG